MNTYEVVYLENGKKNNVHIYAKNEAEAGKAFASKYPEIKTKNAILSVEKLVKNKKSMNNLDTIGFVVGIVIARYYWFDETEVYGWQWFWESLTEGGIDKNDIGDVVKSATFKKTIIAGVLGGIAGKILKKIMEKVPMFK